MADAHRACHTDRRYSIPSQPAQPAVAGDDVIDLHPGALTALLAVRRAAGMGDAARGILASHSRRYCRSRAHTERQELGHHALRPQL